MADEVHQIAYRNSKKSIAIAYILLALFGFLGVHRFYTGRVISGFIILLCTIGGLFVKGPLLISFLFVLFDIFLLYSYIKKTNLEMAIHFGITDKHLL